MKTLIIDDEAKARKGLRSLIEQFIPEIVIAGEAASVKQAKDEIERHKPDLIFLDVEMPDGTGFSLLSGMKETYFDVIFVTAYSEYALQAIKASAVDYILKPVAIEELKQAFNKVQQKRSQQQTEQDALLKPGVFTPEQSQFSPHARLVLPVPKGLKLFPVTEILYCRASGGYTEFHCENGEKILVGKNLKAFEEMLTTYGFLRIHDSSLVNLQHISSYIRGRGGKVVLKNGDELDVSREKKSLLIQMLSGIQ